MSAPLSIAIPHNLGKDEARRRLAENTGNFSKHLPGLAQVSANWRTNDSLALNVSALGQAIDVSVDVEERAVRVSITLPPMLSFFTGAIESGVREAGTKLLGDQRK